MPFVWFIAVVLLLVPACLAIYVLIFIVVKILPNISEKCARCGRRITYIYPESQLIFGDGEFSVITHRYYRYCVLCANSQLLKATSERIKNLNKFAKKQPT